MSNARTVRRVRPADKRSHAPQLVSLPASREKNGTVDDRIYATIHEAVLDHRLPPGTKLKEVALADLFGVSRAAIRKALARLAHTRLVDLRPNRGAVVSNPTVEESRDLFGARAAIEAATVKTLAGKLTRDQLRELRASVRSELDAYQRGDTREGLRLSVEFHRMLARMAGNGVLAEFLDQLVSRTPLVVLAYQGPDAENTCSTDEHTQLLDALAAGDASRAANIMSAHLDALLARLDLQDKEKRDIDLAEILGMRSI